MTTAQKREQRFRRDNLSAAHRILSDGKYQPGSLMRIWALRYLELHPPDADRKESNDARA
jgi:hypothetical protein